jgi:hypothetical protein
VSTSTGRGRRRGLFRKQCPDATISHASRIIAQEEQRVEPCLPRKRCIRPAPFAISAIAPASGLAQVGAVTLTDAGEGNA